MTPPAGGSADGARTCDLAIIGAGPGGYVAALRAARLGMTVTLVERDALGGVCLNRGCIPTKAMLQAAALAHEIGRAEEFGLVVSHPVTVDYPAVLARRDAVVARLRNGVKGLLRRARVDVVVGTASFLDAMTISVAPGAASGAATAAGEAAASEEIRADHIIVATGSRPVTLMIPGADHPHVIDSDGALALAVLPTRLLVVGGGAVGCEWSTIFGRLGSDVTLVEMLPTLLPREEPESSRMLAAALRRDGVTVMTGTSLVGVTEVAGGLRVDLSGADATSLEVDYVLVAAGRRPNSEGLRLEAVGVHLDPMGWIAADRWMCTNIPTVLAIGDVTGQALLAHVASRQAVVAVEKLAGLSPGPVRADRIPSVTYTDPEVAGVGLTEAQAREAGLSVRVGTFPFSASGRALASGVDNGLVKVVADTRFGRVLGVHLVGAHVGELLAEAVLALELEATLDEMTSVIRAHPTLSEAIGEAALAAGGHALHTADPLAAASGTDVEAHVAAAAPTPDLSHGTGEVHPLNHVRRVTAERMTNSWRTAPQVTYTSRVDMTNAIALRADMKDIAEARGIRLSYDAMFVRAVATALLEFPRVNAQWAEGEGIRLSTEAHVGVAVDLTDGLIVPVIRNAHTRSLLDISAELGRLVTAAREGRLGPDDYKGGTFTISNLGLLGIEAFTPIVNLPEAAILGIGAIVPTATYIGDGDLVRRDFATLSLTADHRIMDGGPAARFLSRVVKLMEAPILLVERGL